MQWNEIMQCEHEGLRTPPGNARHAKRCYETGGMEKISALSLQQRRQQQLMACDARQPAQRRLRQNRQAHVGRQGIQYRSFSPTRLVVPSCQEVFTSCLSLNRVNNQPILGVSIQGQQRSQQLASVGTDTTLTVTGL